jgi:hypothetical protein
MTHPSALAPLNAHQTAILAILQDAESMLTDPATRDVAGLALARWALLRELTAYQMLKHAKLIDPVIRKGGPRDAQRLERVKRLGVEAFEAFRANVQRWSATDVTAVWPTYQASALAMIARLRSVVLRDKEELAAIRLPGDLTPPPAAAPPLPGRPTPAG